MGPKVSIACVWTCVSRPPSIIQPLLARSAPKGHHYNQVTLYNTAGMCPHWSVVVVGTNHLYNHHKRGKLVYWICAWGLTAKKILVGTSLQCQFVLVPSENNPTCANITASRRGSVSPLASAKTTPPSLCDRIVRILKLKSTSFG